MRRLLSILVALSFGFTLAVVAPAEAATLKSFRHVQTCPWFMPPDWGDERSVHLDLSLGRWYPDEPGDPIYRCMDQFNTDFRPSVSHVRVVVRWYVGKELAKKVTRSVPNTRSKPVSHFGFAPDGLHQSKGFWRVGGKVVRARVAIRKDGYRIERRTIERFHYPSE